MTSRWPIHNLWGRATRLLSFYLLALYWNKQTKTLKVLEERKNLHWEGTNDFLLIVMDLCWNKQSNTQKYLKKEKFFAVLWCAELTVREGGKDFLPILMDPEKQGEEPRKVYVTSRWPIHNLWGGATMLLSFVHQAQHSPCSPLSTKKSQKVHQSQ